MLSIASVARPQRKPLDGADVRSVLIVDPDPGRAALAAGFSRIGCDVWGADDIAAAIAILQHGSFDLVISEQRLRDGVWSDLLARIALDHSDVRFTVLTKFGSIATAVRAIKSGVAAYRAKPATPEQILADLGNVPAAGPGGADETGPHRTLDRMIWEYIAATVDSAGSLSEAARRLGLDRRSLRRMLAKNPPVF